MNEEKSWALGKQGGIVMKFRVEGVNVPLISAETLEGRVDYVEGEPEIRIKGYKNRYEIKLVETSEITIQLSGLPQELQNLWQNFKIGLEEWAKETEFGGKNE